jgi:lipopolysaccharide/colanic/teichoic acid biosynthesis glycosyltransferase
MRATRGSSRAAGFRRKQERYGMSAPALKMTQRATRGVDWIEQYRPERAWFRGRSYYRCKRAFDLALCLAAMPLVLPLLLLTALLIKLESPEGPVVFAQHRTGKNGRRFKIYKFRTMVPNAEQLKQELAHLNELQWPDFKITNDPRVTRVGRILRKTSLDELPQLFNVVRGDMSLVGPRPTSFDASTYKLWQTERLDVMPGLTGLWQIYGRAQTEFDDRLRLDIAYIEHRCMALDIALLFRTVGAVFEGRGAH